MTQRAKTLLAIPGAIVTGAGILFWLGSAVFATRADVAAVERRVTAVETTLRTIERNVDLIACMHLAEAQGTRWETCVNGYGQ